MRLKTNIKSASNSSKTEFEVALFIFKFYWSFIEVLDSLLIWRVVRVVEGAGLEMRWAKWKLCS